MASTDRVISHSPLWLIAMCAVTVVIAVVFVATDRTFGIVAAILGVWFLYDLLVRLPYRVTVSNEGSVEFRTAFRRRRTTARDIQSIARRRLGWGESPQFKVTFRGGSVVIGRTSDAKALANAIRSLNPAVQTHGL
jgi:hypothetical protein